MRGKPEASPRRLPSNIFIYFCLFAITFAAYSPVGHFPFINYDDKDFVSENPAVTAGLTARGIVWALTSIDTGFWFPLVRISQMLDCELFGLDAGWHHLTNVLLHALSGLLLFGLLVRMTGARWRSACVAFLFLLHPLHVESVAWVTERKDVLSALFAFATVLAYLHYVERPGAGRYALVIVAFGCGLMSKPMLVTLPFLLLLLDAWPLQRIRFARAQDWRGPALRLSLEKIPLIVLSLAASVIAYVAQQRGGSMLLSVPLLTRAGNAAISYTTYIFQFLWPTRMSIFYPYPDKLPIGQLTASVVVLAGVSMLAWRAFRPYPYLAIGWLWYLGSLVPVVGLVQVGAQSRADRYTYLPMIGVSIMLVWGLADTFQSSPRGRQILEGMAVAGGIACVILTASQIAYWKDSETLFRHALAVTRDNFIAHVNLGSVLDRVGRPGEAVVEYRQAVQLQPASPTAHAGLGQALAGQGQTAEALRELFEAVRLQPEFVDARFQLGSLLGRLRRTDEAIAQLEIAVRLRPGDPDFHYNLGNALATRGRMEEAVREFSTALRLNPQDAQTCLSLGNALASLGRLDEAIAEFQQALRLKPDFTPARQSLDYALSLRKAR